MSATPLPDVYPPPSEGSTLAGSPGKPTPMRMEVLRDGEHFCEHIIGTAADLRWVDNDPSRGLDLEHHTGALCRKAQQDDGHSAPVARAPAAAAS
mmetsp:Transcript_38002/g.119948  ORF Transcript_38002/g.119948 Transcript_38002/m.119948 type:complete len:95 (+) Transcript_38002:164-448(+)